MALRLISTTVLALLAGAAAAQEACPTASDLVRGIRFDYSDGSAEIFRPQGPGVLRVDGLIGGNLAYRMELGQGIHLLRYEDISDGRSIAGSLSVYDYGMAPTEMPVPVPGQRWQADVKVIGADGTRSEAQSQAYDRADSLDIGGCTYERVPVVIAYDTEEGYLEGVDHLPELGLGFLSWSQTEDGGRVTTDPVRISVFSK